MMDWYWGLLILGTVLFLFQLVYYMDARAAYRDVERRYKDSLKEEWSE